MNVLNTLKELNVVKSGHFILPSGKHSSVYFQFAHLFKFPDKSEKFVKVLVNKLRNSNLSFDSVVGPAIGGIIMSYELARQLEKPVIYMERINGVMTLGEYFTIDIGQRILIAEDVITSGQTIRESIKLIESLGAVVVGIVCVVNKENIEIKQKIYSCIDFNFKSYLHYQCPLCRKDIPLENGK